SNATITTKVGDYLEFKFNGTGLRLFAYTNAFRGIAKVTIDGQAYTSDNYSASDVFQNKVFEKTGLTDSEHTVKIEVTNTKNSASQNYAICLDAIEVLK
ncbi:hypothetical protein SAMN02745941_04250, partial [Clostridium intestinale DSM 6191]